MLNNREKIVTLTAFLVVHGAFGGMTEGQGNCPTASTGQKTAPAANDIAYQKVDERQ